MTLEELAGRLAALLESTVTDLQPLNTESRNAIARLTLAGPRGPQHAILKTYEPAGDVHWANRFRREEKVLTLLAGSDPPVAPRPIAGWVPATGPAALLMEDAGEPTLSDALLADGSSDLWKRAAEYLSLLHATLRGSSLPLRRTAMAISLDRITGPIVVQRMRVASMRVLGRLPDSGAQRDFRVLLGPVLAAPKAVIHNSMSPLNVVAGQDGWRAIDWETLTHASPVWDWAELLRAPYQPLPFDESERLMLTVTGMDAGSGADLFRRAAFGRHLDSLATVVKRRRQAEVEGRLDRVAEYARRTAFYARDLDDLAARLQLSPRLLDWWRAMKEKALT